MDFGIYGILIIFALFIILLIVNPNLSCFGRRVKSPFYPLLRKKARKKKIKTEDYGFDLGAKEKRPDFERKESTVRKVPAEDYGFDLGGKGRQAPPGGIKHKQERKTEDYGFDPSNSEKDKGSVRNKEKK